MLTFGIMAMLSLGLVGIMSGSDDSDAEQDDRTNDDVLEPEAPAEVETVTETPPSPDEAGSTQDEVTPDETDIVVAQPTAPETTEPETIVEPPATEPPNFAPPVLVVPELTLSDMVTVQTSEDGELADDLVLVEGPQTGEDQDRSFIIQNPQGVHSMELQYRSDITFAVTPNAETAFIGAGLNTNIAAGESTEVTLTENKIDDDGNFFTETVVTKDYANSVDIVLTIDQEDIGDHVAQIDLSNPDDTLWFEFTHLESAMHLITNEEETSGAGDNVTHTTRTLYVIESLAEVRELAPNEIGRIIAGDGAMDSNTRLVAEINLGTSSLSFEGGGNGTVATAQTIVDFTNETPNIYTNFNWASEGEHDGGGIAEADQPVPMVGVVTQLTPASVTVQTPTTTTDTTSTTDTPLVTDPDVVTTPTTPTTQPDTPTDPVDDTPTTDITTDTPDAPVNEIDRALDLWDQANDNLDGLDIPRSGLPGNLNY